MKKAMLLFVVCALVLAGCIPPGQIKKRTAPGQIQKQTGYNPASGKYKPPVR